MKRTAPAVARNREPLLEVLREVLPEEGTVLELASGTGEHCVYFAAALPHLRFQPSDLGREQLASIEAWRLDAGLANVLSPRSIDVTSEEWDLDPVEAVFCANLIHIAPPAATSGLLRGAARYLVPGGVLVTYGPYTIGGRHTAPSNEQFDQWLRGQDPAFGVRDLDEVAAEAARVGISLEQTRAMPANNFTLVFRKAGSSALS